MTLKGNGLNSERNDALSVASLVHTTIILRPKRSARTDAAAMVRIRLHSPAVGWTIIGRLIIIIGLHYVSFCWWHFGFQGTGMHEISTHRLTQTTRKTRMTLNSTGSRRLTPNMETFPQDKVNILGYRILSKKKAKLGTFSLLYQFYWQIYGEINVSMHQNREKQQQKHVLSPKWKRKGRGILQNIHLTIG